MICGKGSSSVNRFYDWDELDREIDSIPFAFQSLDRNKYFCNFGVSGFRFGVIILTSYKMSASPYGRVKKGAIRAIIHGYYVLSKLE